jgi:hypothetical protein
MKKSVFAVVLLSAVAVVMTACGAKTSTTITPPPVTVTSVTITATPTSIQLGQTATCLGTVNYSDGTNDHAVTYAATDGTITSSGVFTPTAAGTAGCTATSTKDATKSGSATISVTSVPVTVLSVSIALTPASGTVAMGQTLSCVGTVTYSDGSHDSNVTYAATDGTITSSGVFTPAAVGSASCTATSSKDSTKSATASITVTLAPIVLSSISPNWFFAPTALSSPVMTISGTGFAGGQLFYASGYSSPSTVSQGNPSTTITFALNAQMRPRFVNIYGTQADGSGKSNSLPLATIGNVKIAAGCPADYIFGNSQGPGSVRRFNRADGTFVDLPVSTYNGGIAVDCNSNGTTNAFVINQGNGLASFNANGSGSFVAGSTGTIGVAANLQIGCALQQNIHEAWCAPLAAYSVQKFSPAIGTPVALDMNTCSANTLWVLDGQGDGTNPVLYAFTVGTDGTLTNQKSLPLPGFTPESQFTQAQLNTYVNWQVSASQTSCTVAVMAPVLNASTGTVSFGLAVVNGTSMTTTTASVVSLPSGSFQVSQDDVHGATLVYVADVSGAQGVQRIWSRANTASASLVQLSSTSTILAMGSILSADGNTINVIGWDPANDAAGLQMVPVPNK